MNALPVEQASKNDRPRGVVFVAILIAIASFVLRYSLSNAPIGSHADEPIVANLAHRAIEQGQLSANWDRFANTWWSKSTYQFSPYTLVQEATAVVVYKLSGWPETMHDHIRLARTMSCIFGALTVLLAFFTARELFGESWSAILCEVTLAVAFLHVRDSTYARVEAFLALAILGCMFLAAKSLSPSSHKGWSYATAFVAGIAIAAKYNALPVLIPVAFAAYAATDPSRRQLNALVLQAAKYGTTVVLGFLFATPEILFNPSPLVDGMLWEMNHYSKGEIPFKAYDFWDNNLFYYSRYLSLLGMGMVSSLLAVGFVILFWQNRSVPFLLLTLFLYVAFFLTILPAARFERNLEVFFAPMAIASGMTAGAIIKWLHSRYSKPVVLLATVALLVGIVAQPALALQRFRVAIRSESSPVAMFRKALPARDDSTITFPMADIPPQEFPQEDRVVVIDNGDKFSKAQSQNWERKYAHYDRFEFRSSWAVHRYPFSLVDAFHGPRRIVVFQRKQPSVDSRDTDPEAVE